MDDVVLIELLKNGDREAFFKVYDRYHKKLYHYVIRFVKVQSLAEDVVHDVFLKLWDNRDKINPQLFTIGYVYRISRNHVFRTMNRIVHDRALRESVLIKLEEQLPDVLEDNLQWKQYEHVLENAVSSLPPQRQKVFILCRQQGKTYEEAAGILGISRHTVKEHMVLAMQTIKKYIYLHTDVALFYLILCRFL